MIIRKDNIVDDFHGTPVADPYRWLEGSAPEVEMWVDEQHERLEQFFGESDHRSKLKERLTELWDYPRTLIPRKVGPWYFYQKNSGLQNQPVLYRQRGLEGKPEVVLDPNVWSSDGTIALSNYSVDDGARYLAYTSSASGSDQQEIRIRDLDKRENLDEVIQWCRFTSMAWLNDEGFYYRRYPKPGTVSPEDEVNFNQVYWHKLGTEQEDDRLVFELPDEKELGFSPFLTADQAYLLLHVTCGTEPRNGLYYQKQDAGEPVVRLLEPGEASYEFLGSEGSVLYVLTDLDASRGRIIAIDLENPGRENWREIIPEQEDVVSRGRYLDGKFVLSLMRNAHSILRIYARAGELEEEVALPTMGFIEDMSGKQGQTEFFIAFASFLYPSTNFRYDLKTRTLSPFGGQELKFDPSEYETSQVFYPSADGTRVSMYLVHRKGLKLDGNNPCLLYGYGGFNIAITPSFSASRILWLELGGVYAVANLRGGSEYGDKWHRAGMLENKQNVFDDFIKAAEWLIDNDYTRRERLAIEGRSNGGLLVSACMTQRPDLYGAVLCIVPVTDMLRYHKFTVGRYWIPEYGDPENPEHFEFMYRYSPLHNVKKADYPATLVVTAYGDDRVVPGHAFKFAATLQDAQQGLAPILLRVDSKSGHGHGKPISKIIAEHADIYGFLRKVFNI
ncbi:MAG TPA: prolyl oligopeptidase family serine peptidase [Limnochordia bacterium]|nr:prolyl oligopeptidase family serine peptidase [Limnochordia bacterium]